MNNEHWKSFTTKYKEGEVITCVVELHTHFGVFVNIGTNHIKGLIPISQFLDEGTMHPKMYPKLGEQLPAVILAFGSDDRQQVELSVKPGELEKAEAA